MTNLINAIAGLISVRSLLVLGGGAVASWLAIDGTLDADIYLTSITTLAGGYVAARFTADAAKGGNGQ